MYSIYANNTCIYNDVSPAETVKLISPVLTLEDSAAGTLTMRVPPVNAGYSIIERFVTDIFVYKDGKEIWAGRVLSEDTDFYNNRLLYCEGELSFLNDTIQPQAEYHNISVREFLEVLIRNHNAKVDAGKKFYVGAVTVTDPNDSLYRYTNLETTIECINDKLIKRLKGHIRIRKEGKKRYIDYLAELPNTNSQTIEFGRNLFDFTRSWDMSDLATAVMPLGARLEENEIEALDSYLTVESVNHEAMIKGASPVAFTSDGSDLRDIIVHGSSSGTGDKTGNLFNKKSYQLSELYPHNSDGHIITSASTGSGWARSLLLNVDPDTRYIFSMKSPTGGSKVNRNRMRVGCYSELPKDGLEADCLFEAPVRNGDTVYCIFTTKQDTKYTLLMLWAGSSNYTEEEIGETIMNADIQLEKQADMTISGYAPLTFRSYGKKLTDYTIWGSSEGVGDLDSVTGKYVIPIITQSKNIFDNKLTSVAHNGLTITVNPDKSITVNGTATATTNFYLYNASNVLSNNIFQEIENGTFTVSGAPEGVEENKYVLSYYYKSSLSVSSRIIRVPPAGLDVDNSNGSYHFSGLAIAVWSGVTVNNVIFRPMIRKQGTSQEYEPYFRSESRIELDDPLMSSEKLVLSDTGIDILTGDCECTLSIGTTVSPPLISVTGLVEPVDFQFSIDYEPFGYKIPVVLRNSSGNTLFKTSLFTEKQLFNGEHISLSDMSMASPSANGSNTLTAYSKNAPSALEVRYNTTAGSKFVLSEDAVSAYGRVEKVVHWDDITTPTALLRKTKQYLSQTQFDNMTIELSALDLHYYDINYEEVKLLDIIRVISPPHGLDRYFPVRKLTVPLDVPENTLFTMGNNVQTSLTGSSANANAEIMNVIERLPKKSAMLEEAKANATAIMNLRTKGHITITNDDNGSNALYISDTVNYREATKFWKACMDGFGYSGDGGRTFGLALTMDGAIVADYITAGTLNGEILKAGSVSASAISQSFKNTIANDINNAKTTITQNFTAADGQLRSDIEEYVSGGYVSTSTFQQTAQSINTEVNKKVNNSDFGTKMEQNYNSFLLGFNSNSNVIKIATDGIGLYEGVVNANNKVLQMCRHGMELWRSGIHIGNIGTNSIVGNPNCRGLMFDLEYPGNFMSWARKESADSDVYTQIFAYSRDTQIYSHAGLQLGAPLYANGFEINGANLTDVRSGGSSTFTGTKTFITAIRETENGIDYDSVTITVKNGMLIN